jgi:hypothetical protein
VGDDERDGIGLVLGDDDLWSDPGLVERAARKPARSSGGGAHTASTGWEGGVGDVAVVEQPSGVPGAEHRHLSAVHGVENELFAAAGAPASRNYGDGPWHRVSRIVAQVAARPLEEERFSC